MVHSPRLVNPDCIVTLRRREETKPKMTVYPTPTPATHPRLVSTGPTFVRLTVGPFEYCPI